MSSSGCCVYIPITDALGSTVDDSDYTLGGGATGKISAEHAATMEALDKKKRARNQVVPTDEGKVKLRLREIGEPITQFGERVSRVLCFLSASAKSMYLTRLVTEESV